MSYILWPHELHNARLPCFSLSPWVYPDYVHWVSDAIQLPHYSLGISPPAFWRKVFLIFSHIRVISNESAVYIRWPKYWSFSFSKSSFNEYSWLISIRIDWFDLLSVKGTSRVFIAPQLENFNYSTLSLLWRWSRKDLWRPTRPSRINSQNIIIEDWNKKVWSQGTPWVTGKFGLGVQIEARPRVIAFCKENALVRANILFQQHKKIFYI